MTQEPQEYVAPTIADQPPTSNQDIDYPTEADKEPQPLEPDWSEDRPIPVYMVERPEAPQVLEWSGIQGNVTANAVELVGARRNRTRVVIKNKGTNSVFLRRDMSINTSLDFELEAGDDVEMLHNDSVWAKCKTAESATVSVMQEYTVELDSPHA